MIDYDAWLLAFALAFTIIAILIVSIIYVNERLYKASPDRYVSRFLARTAAAIIDITLLRLLIEFLLIAANPSYESIILILFSAIPVNPLYIPFTIVATCLSSYLAFYIPLFGGTILFPTSFLVAIISFLYFFLCNAFLGGKTIGRYIARVKSIHKSKIRILSIEEACIISVGKTFLLLDLFLGFMAAICFTDKPELRQFRLSQRIAGAVTMSISFDPNSHEGISDPFLDDDSTKSDGWTFI